MLEKVKSNNAFLLDSVLDDIIMKKQKLLISISYSTSSDVVTLHTV